MITVGIDAGSETIKAVVWDSEGETFVSHILPLEQDPVPVAARRAYDAALRAAGRQPDSVTIVAATGIGRDTVDFAEVKLSEAACCAMGTGWFAPAAVTVIDLGADKCLLLRCHDGLLDRFVRNDRCASGSGRFLEIAAGPLGVSPEELGALAMRSGAAVEITNRCVVFAESEIISLLHQKHRPEDIAAGVFRSLARRIYTMAVKLGAEPPLALVGGVARYGALVRELEAALKMPIQVPSEPMLSCALGAALLAAKAKNG